jgi:hypothetical protein
VHPIRTFVDEEDKVDPEKHVYLKHDMDDEEATWGKCLMWEVMRAAMARVAARRDGRRHVVPVPDVVMAATRQLIERENHVLSFVTKRMQKRADKEVVTLKDAFIVFGDVCKAEKRSVGRKSDFSDELLRILGPYSPASGARKNYWKGWALVDEASETTPVAGQDLDNADMG